jgi:hypothetical protein
MPAATNTVNPPSIGTSLTSSSNTGWACVKLGMIKAAINQSVAIVFMLSFICIKFR